MQPDTSFAAAFGTIRLKRGWILALGIAQIVIGTVALGDSVLVTLFSVLLFGWLLLASAVVQIVHLVRHKEVVTFWLVVNILIDIVAGFYLITQPGLSAIALTLVLALFLVATGVMRFVGALSHNPPHKFWVLLNAVVSFVLGVLLYVHWPVSGLWFIGFAVAVELILRGWSWVMLSSFLGRSAPAAPPTPPTATAPAT